MRKYTVACKENLCPVSADGVSVDDSGALLFYRGDPGPDDDSYPFLGFAPGEWLMFRLEGTE